MSERENIFIDRVKAYAFPFLFGIVAFFMMRLITAVDTIQKDVIEIKLEQARQQGLITGSNTSIEKELNVIKDKINKWE